jgi:serine/threonine protein kinase
MDGGALIGYGTYGCVFDPQLRCSNKGEVDPNSHRVGKLGEKREAETEIRMSRLLSSANWSDEYFSLADVNNICKYEGIAKDSQAKKDISECKIKCKTIREDGTSHTIYYTMPFGGFSIIKYLDGITKGESSSKPPRAIITHLLEACATLTLNNIIHYDIHDGNILVDEKTLMPRIIDFGLSYTADELSQDFLDQNWKQFSPEYPTEPPEITIITGIARKKMTFNAAFQEVLNKKAPLKRAAAVLNMSLASQKKAFQAFWDRSQSVKNRDWPSFFKFYWPGFDAWSVGAVIIKMYITFSLDPKYSESADWKMTASSTKEILRGLLQMSPQKRIDCVEALAMFDPENRVVSSSSGKAWLKEKERVRAAL